MPCDTKLKPKQTLKERVVEVQAVIDRVSNRLAAGLVKPRVGPQGAIAFEGITDKERDGVSDACIYRLLMVKGSALARTRITQAEQIAGRSVDRRVVAQGVHSHDGGRSWHGKG